MIVWEETEMSGPSCVDGEGEINWLGVDYYNRLIDYMLEKGNSHIK